MNSQDGHEGESDERRFYSQTAADAMSREIARLNAANTQLQADVAYWEQQTNHWYMRANYTPAEIAGFDRRRKLTIDEESGDWLPMPEDAHGNDDNGAIGTNSSIRYNGTTGGPEERLDPGAPGRAAQPAPTRGIGMSYITRTGYLARTPKLQQGEKGPYTYARILVTDRERREDGTYGDGPTIAYDVAVSGAKARELVNTAERCGNIGVMFSGRYRVTEESNDKGTWIKHEVRADQLGISLHGQTVTVERGGAAAADEPSAFTDETPF